MTDSSLLERFLTDAREAALEAWKVIQPFHQGDFEVFQKEGEGPATEADIAADRRILEILQDRYDPREYGYLTEETEKGGGRLQRPYCWIIDPIDGTRDFIAGGGDFAVHIGIAGEVTPGLPFEPLAGVVYQPMAGTMSAALRGGGAWQEDVATGVSRPLRVTDSATLEDDARVLVTSSRINERLMRALNHLGVQNPRQRGSLGVKIVEVAAGTADLYLNTARGPCKEWDACAPHIILREAGGRFTTLSGREIRYNQRDYTIRNGLLASNGNLHTPVLDRLREMRDLLWAGSERAPSVPTEPSGASRT